MNTADEAGLDLQDLGEMFALMPPKMAERTYRTLHAMDRREIDRMVKALNTAHPQAFIDWMDTRPGEEALAGMMLQSSRTMLMMRHATEGDPREADQETQDYERGKPGEAHAQIEIIEREVAEAERWDEDTVGFSDGTMVTASRKQGTG